MAADRFEWNKATTNCRRLMFQHLRVMKTMWRLYLWEQLGMSLLAQPRQRLALPAHGLPWRLLVNLNKEMLWIEDPI